VVVNYDKNSFLAGIAVGRQLKGWATAQGRGIGGAIVRVGTGEKELVNMQGQSERNYVLTDAGIRYVPLHIADGNMYVFAAALEPFTFRTFSNNSEEGVTTGSIIYYGTTYHYAHAYWYSPTPTPTIPCNTPVVIKPRQISLSADMLVTQGMLMLNY